MRKRWIGWACAIVAAGCGAPAPKPAPETTGSVTREVRSLGITIGGEPGALEDFRPAIAPFGDQGRCSVLSTENGGRMLLLRFEGGPGGAERNVSLEFDAAGTLRDYADVRGDLTAEARGQLTSVTIRLARGDAQASNRTGDPVPVYQGTANAALDLPTLGNPRAMIEQIKTRCGAGS